MQGEQRVCTPRGAAAEVAAGLDCLVRSPRGAFGERHEIFAAEDARAGEPQVDEARGPVAPSGGKAVIGSQLGTVARPAETSAGRRPHRRELVEATVEPPGR